MAKHFWMLMQCQAGLATRLKDLLSLQLWGHETLATPHTTARLSDRAAQSAPTKAACVSEPACSLQ